MSPLLVVSSRLLLRPTSRSDAFLRKSLIFAETADFVTPAIFLDMEPEKRYNLIECFKNYSAQEKMLF